jgi:hypothetical protein
MALPATQPVVNYEEIGTGHGDLSFPSQGALEWLAENEKRSMPGASLLANHPKLEPKMRAILIDWMMEVCQDFGLKRETFNVAVSVVDRFMAKVTPGLPCQLCVSACGAGCLVRLALSCRLRAF